MWALIWFSAVPWKALLLPANWLTPRAVRACSHLLLCWHTTSYPSCISEGGDISPPPQSKLHDHSLGAYDSHTQSSSLLSGSLTHPPGVHSASVILQPGCLRTTFGHQNFCRPLHSVTFSIHKMRQIHEFCYVHELELLSRTPWLPSVFGW